ESGLQAGGAVNLGGGLSAIESAADFVTQRIPGSGRSILPSRFPVLPAGRGITRRSRRVGESTNKAADHVGRVRASTARPGGTDGAVNERLESRLATFLAQRRRRGVTKRGFCAGKRESPVTEIDVLGVGLFNVIDRQRHVQPVA